MTFSKREFENSSEDYMTNEQLNFFKNKLLEEKKSIIAELENRKKDNSSNSYIRSADGSDLAVDELRMALICSDYNRKYEDLEEIEECLERIKRGDYGYCIETGEPIGIKRLTANPKAKMCLDAQEKYDRLERAKIKQGEENNLDGIDYNTHINRIDL